MTQGHETEFMGYPDNYMLGVFQDDDQAERAYHALAEAGFGEDEVVLCIPAESIDSSGKVHGPLARIERAIEHLLTNKAHMSDYEQAAREGACVIGIHAEAEDDRKQAEEIFFEHGARNVNYFGKWAVETISRGPQES